MFIELEINRENIEKNLKKIRKINNNIICVLKDDAYGLGIKNILPVLIENGCHYFAVAYIEEALEIKKIVKKNYAAKEKVISVMTLNHIEKEDIGKAVRNNIEITLFSIQQLESYIRIFHKVLRKNKIWVHVKLNTGMNRLGFNEDELDILKSKLDELSRGNYRIGIKTVYSHISDSEDIKAAEVQIKKYEDILTKLKEDILEYGDEKIYGHIQASPLLFKYGMKYNYDFARIGMAIYGMEPLSEPIGLENTIRLVSRVINIRNIKKGDKVSYGKNGFVGEDRKVAVIPVGYAHGLQKQIENSNPYVLIKEKKAYILGEICMDMIIVDITGIKNVEVGDEAVIIGKQGKKEITLLEMADWADTIQDDILTGWNKSIKRTVK